MRPITDEDVDWIRRDVVTAMSLASALPRGFAVYGVLDLDEVAQDGVAPDRALLEALLAHAEAPLIAGRLIRNEGGESEPGTEHLLYASWRYRFLLVEVEELQERLDADRDSYAFPEVLFPIDRRWLVSTLWDDSWRSIGTTEEGALAVEAVLPAFERVDRDVDLRTTGRNLY